MTPLERDRLTMFRAQFTEGHGKNGIGEGGGRVARRAARLGAGNLVEQHQRARRSPPMTMA